MHELLEKMDLAQIKLAGIGIILLLMAALASYLLMPSIKSYYSASTSLDNLKTVVESGNTLQDELDIIRQNIEAIKQKLHGDISNLPENRLESYIIEKLQNISWNNNIQLVSVKPEKGRTVDKFKELLFDVEIQGSYFDIYAWLNQLGTELGFVVISQFELLSNQPAQNNILKMNVKMTAYRTSSE